MSSPQALPPTLTDASVTLTFGTAGQYYGYCTVADVKFEFPNATNFNTLTNSIVAQEITYAAQEMQGVIDAWYQMPYTGSNGAILLQLRDMNAKLATANIIDRYFQGAEPDLSPAAAERRGWVESLLLDLKHGNIHWALPQGDAIARGMKPVYQTSQGAQVFPGPTASDPAAQYPFFGMTATRFTREGML